MSAIAHTATGTTSSRKNIVMILIGLGMMAAIMLAPTPAGLSLAGQRIIAIMVFTVFMWITRRSPTALAQ